jgi:FkbM family methyltransferase
MEFFKRVVRHTFLYDIAERFRARKVARQWTPHDHQMANFYSQFLSAGDVCFDVGANFGNRAKVFLKLGATVVAVEPQNKCVRALKTMHEENNRLIVIQKALGALEGMAELMISRASTISSLSQEWIEAVKRSGRFSEYSWDRREIVNVTTLDRLIAEYGVPSFIKIDVEGFEYQVIIGLSKQVNAISFEFTPEMIETTIRCIEHLNSLGVIKLNYSIGETMKMSLDKWVNPKEMIELLSVYQKEKRMFGDVYVKFC